MDYLAGNVQLVIAIFVKKQKDHPKNDLLLTILL